MIALFLLLIAAPIYLLIAGVFIGFTFTYLAEILPVIIGIYLFIVFLVVVFAPLKPWYDKHHDKIKLTGNLIFLVLFGPLIVVLAISIIALPFVMIYAIADHPFLWYAVILFFVFVVVFSLRQNTIL